MNIVAEYDYYTLEQAEKILQQKRHHEWLVNHHHLERVKRNQRKQQIYYAKQKLLAALLLFTGLMAAIFIETEGITVAAFMWAVGIPLLLTNKMWLANSYWEAHKED